MTSLREDIQELMNKRDRPLPPKTREMIEEAAVELYEKGEKLPKDVFHITDSQMETIYNYGYQMFQSGKYKDASQFFNFLRTMNPLQYKYWFGLAACHHSLQDYNKAHGEYGVCTLMEPENPIPYFHIYDCHMQQQNPLAAYYALKDLVECARDQSAYATLKERALMEISKLKAELKELKKHAAEEEMKAEEKNQEVTAKNDAKETKP